MLYLASLQFLPSVSWPLPWKCCEIYEFNTNERNTYTAEDNSSQFRNTGCQPCTTYYSSLFNIECSVRVNLYLHVVIVHFLPLRVGSHCDGTDIIFNILVSSIVGVTNCYLLSNGGVHIAMTFLRPKFAIAGTVWTRLKMAKKLKIETLMSRIPCMHFGMNRRHGTNIIFNTGLCSFLWILAVFHRAGFHTSIVMLWEKQSRRTRICTQINKTSTPLGNLSCQNWYWFKVRGQKGKYFEQKTERKFFTHCVHDSHVRDLCRQGLNNSCV